jgi:hypothetical protein
VGLTGRWLIQEMDLWNRDVLDLAGSAFIELRSDNAGRFGFIAVRGEMDCRESTIDDNPALEFRWFGNDDCDQASGRGWVVLQRDETLKGRIYFHLGEDSAFRATRA